MTMIGPIAFVILSACGLIFAAPTPWRTSLINPPPLYSTGRSLSSPSETAESQWIIPAATLVGSALNLGTSIVGKAVSKFIDRHVCGKGEAELQEEKKVQTLETHMKELTQASKRLSEDIVRIKQGQPETRRRHSSRKSWSQYSRQHRSAKAKAIGKGTKVALSFLESDIAFVHCHSASLCSLYSSNASNTLQWLVVKTTCRYPCTTIFWCYGRKCS